MGRAMSGDQALALARFVCTTNVGDLSPNELAEMNELRASELVRGWRREHVGEPNADVFHVSGSPSGFAREVYTVTLRTKAGEHVSIHRGQTLVFDMDDDGPVDVPTCRIVVASLACLGSARADRFLLEWLRESAFSRWINP